MNAHAAIPAPQPLYDVEVEQALIGAAITNDQDATDAISLVPSEDFSDPLHARLWEAIIALRNEGVRVTPLTLGARMSDDDGLTSVGGRKYLVSLARSSSATLSIKDCTRIIADLALRRRLDEQLAVAQAKLSTPSNNVMDCLSGVLELSAVAVDRSARNRGHMPIAEAVDTMLQETEDAINGKQVPAIKTGLTRLDSLTGGMQAGDVVIVAGRPGAGKTVLLTTVARAAAQAQRPAIFFSLEMPRRQILHRMICDFDYDTRGKDKPLAYTRFRSSKLRDGEFDRAIKAGQIVRNLPIEIFDTSGMTIHEIAAHAERFVSRSKVMGVVVVDYLQIVSATDRYAGSKTQEITEISNSMKRLAKRLGWPVVAGCQLNREVEKRPEKDRRPMLSDLRESGSIEQDADIVIGMHRPAYYVEQKKPIFGKGDGTWTDWIAKYEAVKNDLELVVLKNRSGRCDVVKCHVEIGTSVIRDEAGLTMTGDDEAQGLIL